MLKILNYATSDRGQTSIKQVTTINSHSFAIFWLKSRGRDARRIHKFTRMRIAIFQGEDGRRGNFWYQSTSFLSKLFAIRV